MLERAILMGDTGVIQPADLRFSVPTEAQPGRSDDGLTMAEVERRHIERVLRAEKGRIDPAAQRLGLPRSTLYKRIKALGIAVPKG